MAQRIEIVLSCDFCGAERRDEPATETVRAAVDSPEYVLDLCDVHTKQVRDFRELIIRVGRTSRRGARREKPRPWNPDTKDMKRRRTQQLQEVREWARGNGYTVTNARIPYRVQRAYNDAHPDNPVSLADGGRGTARD